MSHADDNRLLRDLLSNAVELYLQAHGHEEAVRALLALEKRHAPLLLPPPGAAPRARWADLDDEEDGAAA